MAGYDENELRRLQNDAARRVQDMQDRSRRPNGGGRKDHYVGNVRTERMNMPGFGQGAPRDSRAPEPRHEPEPSKPSSNGLLSQLFGRGKGIGGLLGGKGGGMDLSNLINLKGLKLDGDLSLVLMIVLMMSGEEVDELLLMALIYIML